MENKKICFCCRQHENPFIDHDGTPDNIENFGIVSWFGKDTTDDVHNECWYIENR